ncbi:MAG: hypothetical protein R3322_02680 [Kiloniellales bacterium]|nr:hypothetical protein [Kiloniellales bacterium]
MTIWRNLDPQTLGLLLAHAAELRAAQSRARRRRATAAPEARPTAHPHADPLPVQASED